MNPSLQPAMTSATANGTSPVQNGKVEPPQAAALVAEQASSSAPEGAQIDAPVQSISAGELQLFKILGSRPDVHQTDEIALYDRQIRLWGVEAQEK